MIKPVVIALSIFSSVCTLAQTNEGSKHLTSVGFQVQSVSPVSVTGKSTYHISSNGFETRISQQAGFGIGAVIRTNLSEKFAIETGINFTHRRFNLDVSVPDSNIVGSSDMTFIEYDIPINAIMYTQLSDRMFLNSSIGVAISYQPSDTRVSLYPQDRHYFTLYGLRKNKIGANLNASLGCEYRTERAGSFYLGGSARLPLQSLFEYAAVYNYDSNVTDISSRIDGSFLSLDVKYLLPIQKK